MVVRFLARNDSDSGWITDVNQVAPYLQQLKYDEVLIKAGESFRKMNTVFFETDQKNCNFTKKTSDMTGS